MKSTLKIEIELLSSQEGVNQDQAQYVLAKLRELLNLGDHPHHDGPHLIGVVRSYSTQHDGLTSEVL